MVYFFDGKAFFKSADPYYHRELNGKKPNTVRNVTPIEYELLKAYSKITIKHEITGQEFTREINDISIFGVSDGKIQIIISWVHPWGPA